MAAAAAMAVAVAGGRERAAAMVEGLEGGVLETAVAEERAPVKKGTAKKEVAVAMAAETAAEMAEGSVRCRSGIPRKPR